MPNPNPDPGPGPGPTNNTNLPILHIDSLPNNGKVQGPGPLFTIIVTGTVDNRVSTVDPASGDTEYVEVEWSMDGGSFSSTGVAERPASFIGHPTSLEWDATLQQVPIGKHVIRFQVVDTDGTILPPQQVSVEAVDTQAPNLIIDQPEGYTVQGHASSGGKVTISGTADDACGVSVVQWALDGSAPSNATTNSNWKAWSADVQVPLGTHEIKVIASDTNGNTTTESRHVNVSTTYEPQDQKDNVSSLAYLRDLIEFAKPTITVTPHGQPASNDTARPLEVGDLAREFYQPFGDLTVEEQVSQLRICIEVLRRFLPKFLNPVAYWKFDEGSGTTTKDAAGNGNDGTLNGATWSSAGKIGSALSFDGKSNTVSVASKSNITEITNDFTIAFWANPQATHEIDPENTSGTTGTAGQRYAFGPEQGKAAYGSSDHAGVGVSVGTNGISVYEYSDNSYMPALLVDQVPVSGWAHIAVLYEDKQPTLYLNGNLRRTGKKSPKQFVHVNPKDLGGMSYGYFSGQLDDVRIYNRALSDKEVTDLAKVGAVDPSQAIASVAAGYLQEAYETLLNQLSTSYEELVLARSDDATRAVLAQRLGIDANNLQALLLQPNQITESKLEELFGLRDTARDPITATPVPDLLSWQLANLRALWQQEDHPVGIDALLPVIVDPDLIDENYLIKPTQNNPNPPAYKLWKDRSTWIGTQLANLEKDKQPGETDKDRFDRLVGATLGPMADLVDLDTKRQQGNDIELELQQKQLDVQAFSYLMQLYKLLATTTATNPVSLLDAEWSDVYSILVQVQKLRKFVDWQKDEVNLTLSTDFFQLPSLDSTDTASSLPSPQQVPRWRGTEQDRRAWQDKLRARAQQEQTVVQTLRAAVDATEEATLPLLRDALVGLITDNAADTGRSSEDVSNWLTEWLLIDVGNGRSQKTTRIDQAIETIQSILFSLRMRTNRFKAVEAQPDAIFAVSKPDWNLAANETLPTSDFDQAWEWMGSYDTWRSAMLVFIYPENLLLPSLRGKDDRTQAFSDFLERLRAQPQLTADQARRAANDYLASLGADVVWIEDGLPAGAVTQLDSQNEGLWGAYFNAYSNNTTTPSAPPNATRVDQSINFSSDGTVSSFASGIGPNNFFVRWTGTLLPPTTDQYIFYAKADDGVRLYIDGVSLLPPTAWSDHAPQEYQSNPMWLQGGRPYDIRLEYYQNQGGAMVQLSWSTPSLTKTVISKEGLRAERGVWTWVSSNPEPFSGSLTLRSGVFQGMHQYSFTSATDKLTVETGDTLFAYVYLDPSNPPDEVMLQWDDGTSSDHRAYWGSTDHTTLGSENTPSRRHMGQLPPTGTWARLEVPADKANGVDLEGKTVSGMAFILHGGRATWDSAGRSPSQSLLPLELRTPVELRTPDFKITEQLDGSELISLSTRVKKLFGGIADLSLAPSYLKEVFYFVPMQLALQLQRSGQYEAALDWFRTVYAYELPLDQRKIYYGLVLEENIASDYGRVVPAWLLADLNPHVIAANRANAYTRFTLQSLARCLLEFADSEFSRDSDEPLSRARTLYLSALDLLKLPVLNPKPADIGGFNPNPIAGALRLHAELNLLKLRDNRDIAGTQRQSELSVTQDNLPSVLPSGMSSDGQITPSGVSAPPPTAYRYSALIERAKQLVGLAQQIEAAFLSALEKFDAESYTLLKAKQDLDLAHANVHLQDLRYNEANDGVSLADLQQQRAQFQADHYNDLIRNGVSNYERSSLDHQWRAVTLHDVSAGLSAVATYEAVGDAAIGVLLGGGGGFAGIFSNAAAAASSEAASESAMASALATLASYERRRQEWQFQQGLAQKDVAIGAQQIKSAQDQLKVADQELSIAQTQDRNANATVSFLTNKFTNADLYEWMSGILGQVYSYFLQQATAMARLAQNQLAFERQAQPPSLIKPDYWQPPSDGNGTIEGSSAAPDQGNSSTAPDRRGLTGSARLLEDIYQLDQYAFETDERKLQLSKTISLAQLAPAEFQRFRETGVLPFATPMELFDQDFPGHYLRLIKRVRTSVIALIPPTQGIRATLSTSGISRVTVGNDVFQTIDMRRDPESVALSSPTNATGLFELDQQSNMLLPFEAMGVDASWEFRMPKAANPFDYSTIADVLITVEYTALDSLDYCQQVIRQLDRSVSADRAFSLRQQFPDRWYDLHNPPQDSSPTAPPPMTVSFNTEREDFPPNVEDLMIQHLVLYIVHSGGGPFAQPLQANLNFTPQGGSKVGDGSNPGSTSIDGIISTRRGNASSGWRSIIGKPPVGQWELALPNTDDVKKLFEGDEIEDILFVITYSGQTPQWPS